MIEVQNTKSKGLSFAVKSGSGKIILQSVGFKNQGEIEQTIKQLTSHTKLINKVERKTNFEGKFLFAIKNEKNKIIGYSGCYTSQAGMENGIKHFIENLS